MAELESTYSARLSESLVPIAKRVEEHVRGNFIREPRIDRISARAKSVERFLAKARKEENGVLKYANPLSQIQDQVGARIITFFLSDVRRLSSLITELYRPLETRLLVPDSDREFDYVGQHFILLLPTDISRDESVLIGKPPLTCFELQLKTLFQHAWSEANHDVGYKPERPLTPHERRLIAYASAQAWGADRVFEELASRPSDR